MAPMALHELREAGGLDLTREIEVGLDWVFEHPEVDVSLIDEEFDMVWRSVRRREPVRASRGVKAVLTSIRPGARLSWADRFVPPTEVDFECRPYEFGWMLYAWRSRPLADLLPDS